MHVFLAAVAVSVAVMFSDTMVFSIEVLIYLSVIVLETHYLGDTIVLVFLDGSSPAPSFLP
jgi:hypothetical protein